MGSKIDRIKYIVSNKARINRPVSEIDRTSNGFCSSAAMRDRAREVMFADSPWSSMAVSFDSNFAACNFIRCDESIVAYRSRALRNPCTEPEDLTPRVPAIAWAFRNLSLCLFSPVSTDQSSHIHFFLNRPVYYAEDNGGRLYAFTSFECSFLWHLNSLLFYIASEAAFRWSRSLTKAAIFSKGDPARRE